MRLLLLILALVSLSDAASFDTPRTKKTVDLGPVSAGAAAHIKVNCYYYSTFMVKEVDLGEKGADRLAIVPVTPGIVPRCTRVRTRTEKVINSDEWTGYFKGVKGGLVFFDADDGVNGGLGFAVYDPRTGKKLFEDSVLGSLEFKEAPAGQISFRYTRVFETKCVLPQDPDACWAEIQKATSLQSASPPDCKQGYEKSAQEMAKGRCQAQDQDDQQCLAKEIQLARDQARDAPSVLAYPVEVDIVLGPAAVKPRPGDLQCWPSD